MSKSLKNQIDYKVHNQVANQVKLKVRDQVRDQISNKVHIQVWEVYRKVWGKVLYQIRKDQRS